MPSKGLIHLWGVSSVFALDNANEPHAIEKSHVIERAAKTLLILSARRKVTHW
jgi:hypothetical protein